MKISMIYSVIVDNGGYLIGNNLWIASENDYIDDAIKVLTKEEALKNSEEMFQLKEGCSYEYSIQDETSILNPIPGIVHQSKRYSYRGRITPGNYVGRLPLKIITPSGNIDIALEIRSSKSEYRKEYRRMLEDITTECTNLLMMHSSPITQRYTVDYDSDSESLYQRFAFVQSMVDSDDFSNAVYRVINSPVTRWKAEIINQDSRRVRRIGSSHIKQFASGNNRIPLPETHPLSKIVKSIPHQINTQIKTDTLDNPENRFIKHALTEFARFTGSICQKIEKANKLIKPNIYFEAKKMEEKISEWLGHNTFREVSQVTTLPLNNPVLQRKEGYREIFKTWLMYDLAAKLTWNGLDPDTYNAGKRDVATLYEYWLFFKLLRMVEEIFDIPSIETKKLIQESNNGLDLLLKAGKHTAIDGTFTHKDRTLHIKYNYNRTFSYADFPKAGSWTQKMRPDYTLSFWPYGFSEDEAEEQELIIHIHFDAKYKVEDLQYILDNNETDTKDLNDEKELEKTGKYKRADLLKMHAYKDAIRRTAGAYIIYPGSKTKTHKGFHELIPGLGAFAVSPLNNGNGLEHVKQFIINVLDHYTNRTTQREFYSFYKYKILKDPPEISLHERLPEYSILKSEKKERLKPAQEINILIGYVQKKQKEWIKKYGFYNIRMDREITPQFAGADYLLLYDEIEGYRKLHLWENGFYKIKNNPIIRSKKWLSSKKYPSPSKSEYFVYEISTKIEKWSADKIEEVYLPSQIAYYRPFTKPLPEIFIKKSLRTSCAPAEEGAGIGNNHVSALPST